MKRFIKFLHLYVQVLSDQKNGRNFTKVLLCAIPMYVISADFRREIAHELFTRQDRRVRPFAYTKGGRCLLESELTID